MQPDAEGGRTRAWVSARIEEIEGFKDEVLIDMVCRWLREASLDQAGLEAHLEILMQPDVAKGFASEVRNFMEANCGKSGANGCIPCSWCDGKEVSFKEAKACNGCCGKPSTLHSKGSACMHDARSDLSCNAGNLIPVVMPPRRSPRRMISLRAVSFSSERGLHCHSHPLR